MPAAEADLIARIVEDPDDATRFGVYGDWLLERGDPRGELIALQAAGRAEEADRLLALHGSTLLGRLAPHRNDLVLDWHLGFVHSAQVIAMGTDQAIRIVNELAYAPTCQFLRRLRVVVLGDGDYTRIDHWLARVKQPQTLEHIVLGDSEHVPSDALLAAFPRLGRRRTSWPELATTIAGLEPQALGIPADELVAMTDTEGREIPLAPTALAHGLALELGAGQPLGIVPLLRATCAPAALDRFAASVVRATAPVARQLDNMWGHWTFEAIRRLGGPVTARALGAILDDPPDDVAARLAGTVLVNMQTPLASLELFAWKVRVGNRFREIAGLLVEVDADLPIPPEATLARAGADPGDLPAELAERFAALDLRVLDRLVATGWRAPLREAIELFVHSPRAKRASGLVWARARSQPASRLQRLLRQAPPAVVEAFQLTEAGPVDVAGRPVGIDLDELIWLVHPTELDHAELARWRRVHQPIAQLDRLVISPKDRVSLDTVRDALVAFPTELELRERGWVIVPRYTYEIPYTRAFRYREVDHWIEVDVKRGRIRSSSRGELPAAVVHEVARNLLEPRLSARDGS